jgi:GT2 family glycosyltransferase
MSETLPTVTALVLNENGRQHLDTCLASLEAQSYSRERFEIVLLDKASSDGSLEFVRDRYPGVRVLQFAANLGRCALYNDAIKSCQSEFVALVSNDTRVAPDWLTELVSAATRHDAAAVASKILSWTGDAIDFAGGVTSIMGHSWTTDSGQPVTRRYDEEALLFPCAGSTLFASATFLDAGGFDEDFFDCCEDVDLGWRLNLFGERLILAPKAVTYRRTDHTFPGLAPTQRLRLVERNALAMIYKNYEASTLERVFPVAIALLLLRATMRSGIDTLTLVLSTKPPQIVDTDPHLVARLIGLEDFCRQLPALRRKRELIQNRRRRSDAELLDLFVDPLRLHETGGLYEDVARALIQEFRIDELVGTSGKRRPLGIATAVRQGFEREVPPRSPVPTSPRVSIVILTALGPTHLAECLESIRRQSYPADRVEVIVVDNGSSVDPTPEAQRLLPGTRVIRNDTNIGFAAGNNRGAAAATGDYVIFLNDDTRVHPDWLRELVATARRSGGAAVASYILDWSGTMVDFVDGALNFQGKGFQLEYGVPVERLTAEEKPLLFACGCAMLVDRAVFSEVGGWDERAFAYYEDVELGWRLHVLGHEVWLAPKAVVYHKHHGTSGQWPEPPRQRLYERNSLRALYGLLETESLQRVLPAALMLAADRALLETGLSRAAEAPAQPAYRRWLRGGKAALVSRGIGRSTPLLQAARQIWSGGLWRLAQDVHCRSANGSRHRQRESYLIEHGVMPATVDVRPQPIPISAAAMLSGIYGFLSEIPQLVARRADLQRSRRVEDREILGRFGAMWLAPSGARLQSLHDQLHTALVDEFALAALSERPRSRADGETRGLNGTRANGMGP